MNPVELPSLTSAQHGQHSNSEMQIMHILPGSQTHPKLHLKIKIANCKKTMWKRATVHL